MNVCLQYSLKDHVLKIAASYSFPQQWYLIKKQENIISISKIHNKFLWCSLHLSVDQKAPALNEIALCQQLTIRYWNCHRELIYLGTSLSPSTHSSNMPRRTAETSRYGSHTVKPRPIRSTAARRMGVFACSRSVGGCSKRKLRALPARNNGRVYAFLLCIHHHLTTIDTVHDTSPLACPAFFSSLQ